jgi:hypothetical protein
MKTYFSLLYSQMKGEFRGLNQTPVLCYLLLVADVWLTFYVVQYTIATNCMLALQECTARVHLLISYSYDWTNMVNSCSYSSLLLLFTSPAPDASSVAFLFKAHLSHHEPQHPKLQL